MTVVRQSIDPGLCMLIDRIDECAIDVENNDTRR